MKGGESKPESKKAESKLGVSRKAAEKPATKTRKETLKKDPDKPKRPYSVFFVFMEEFRKKFNEVNPNKKIVTAVGNVAGKKWKSMSLAEKEPYFPKAEQRKLDYEKEMRPITRSRYCRHLDDIHWFLRPRWLLHEPLCFC